MTSDLERNLLLGLMGVQAGLIDHWGFLAAFEAWNQDQSRSLVDQLVERGALTLVDRGIVEAMVARELEARSERTTLEDGTQAWDGALPVEAGVTEGCESTETALHPLSDSSGGDGRGGTTHDAGRSTSTGHRFRVQRAHARGGLGAVFVAMDTELNREVALKEILDSQADNPISRQRFLLEAEITGGLEHPGIVPVYSLGRHGNGRPFYAMRFIRGDSLKVAIRKFLRSDSGRNPGSRSLVLRQLLRRFLDVCNAIEYAHRRGVLHRDIKPANIVLGKHGETLVVDWGLAKALGKTDELTDGDEAAFVPNSASRSSETRAGRALGTPAYMSPEQANGDLESLGPATDVYSLGATLYCLLTGQDPFQGSSVQEILGAVGEGRTPPAPRKLDPSIHASLEAVCLKAMSHRLGDRYPSARFLAEDVERWLADEPVTVRRESLLERWRRWARNHRTFIMAGTAGLLMALVGLAAVLVVQTQARNSLAVLNDQLMDRENLAIRAVQRFGDAVANQPTLKNTPSLEELRKQLLKEPLTYFHELCGRLQSQKDLRPESLDRLASAAFKLGYLANEIGDQEGALPPYLESEQLRRKLAQDYPQAVKFQRELAATRTNLAILYSETGELDQSLRAFVEALSIYNRLVQADSSSLELRAGLATGHSNLGDLFRKLERPVEALEQYEEARKIQESLCADAPQTTDFDSGLGDTLNKTALIDMEAGRFEAAHGRLIQAIARQRRTLKAQPKDTQSRIFLVDHLSNLIQVAKHLGHEQEAVDAENQLEELRAGDPRYAALVARLQDVLAGAEVRDSAERIRLAGQAYETKFYATAVKLWGEAIVAQPALGDDRIAQVRYNAACAAALAASGEGRDNTALKQADKHRLRGQALAWLQEELSAWTSLMDDPLPARRTRSLQVLRYWKQDPELASVHDPKALLECTEAERLAWQSFWDQVDRLLAGAVH